MTPESRKKGDREGMEQEGQQYKGQPIDGIGVADKGPVSEKRRRLPSQERLRNERVYQLRESL
jgi:hypothetical protein